MNVTLAIPNDLSLALSASYPDLGRAALEALAAEAYEKDELTQEQVRRLLNLSSRWEAQAFLAERGVWSTLTVEEILQDAEVASAASLLRQ